MPMTTDRYRSPDHAGDDVKPHPNPTFREAALSRRVLAARTEHPLGVGADPTVDHCTRANRRAVAGALKGYFHGTLGESVNDRGHHGGAKVGWTLGRKFVSRLEITEVLDLLRDDHADLWPFVELAYAAERFDGEKWRTWNQDEIAERYACSVKTVRARLDDALNVAIEIIWRDEG